jgi:hypothetical protein
MAYLGQRTFASFEKKVSGWGEIFEEDEEVFGDVFHEDKKNKEADELSINEFMFRGVKRTMRREGDHLYLSPFTEEDAEPFSQAGIDAEGYPYVIHNGRERFFAFVMLEIMNPEPGDSFTAHYMSDEGVELQVVIHTYNPPKPSIQVEETKLKDIEEEEFSLKGEPKDSALINFEGKPDDILFEEVPTHQWNSTGLKFYRRDGKPLTSSQVYVFIREQKKLGNQEFIDAFKPHIKGKDSQGTYPTFEIANSKYKYYGYSFDPEWGKKQEVTKEPEITKGDKKYIDREVYETAFVKVRTAEREKFTGIRLHDFPSPEGKNIKGKGAKIYNAGTPLTIVAYGNEDAPGWILVQTPDGQTGWIAQSWTVKAKTGDNSRYTLRYIEKGETVTDLLREIDGVVRDISYDNKLFANALWLLNKDNPDVYLNPSNYQKSLIDNAGKNAIDPWDREKRAILQSIEVKQGGQVKVPTKQTIDQMIASGQIQVRPDWVSAGVKTARIIEGLMTGIPIGIYEQAKDTVTGIWDLIKSIFTGEILDQLVELYNALWEMGWDDVKKLLWGLLGVDPDRFDEIWNGKNVTTARRYQELGEIIGRIIFEIVVTVFTGGAALAKYGAKIPALAKISTSLKKVKKIIPDDVADKLRKTEKATDKVDEAMVPPKKKPDLKETFNEKRAEFEKEFDKLKGTKAYKDKRKAKFEEYKGKKKGKNALDELEYNEKYDQLYKNREIGKIGEQVFEEFMGGYISPRKAVKTSKSNRFIDNIDEATGTAREIKTGKVKLTESIMKQIDKDIEINKFGRGGLNRIEWHFLDGADKAVLDYIESVRKKAGLSKSDFYYKVYE